MMERILGVLGGIAVIAAPIGVAAQKPVTAWTAHMTGTAETPANQSKGSGTATFTLKGTMLTYTVTARGMSGPAVAGHIHVGPVGVAGPPVFTFTIEPNTVKGGTVAKGTLDLGKQLPNGVTGDSLRVLLLNGQAYVNVHTTLLPKGEIRGQLMARK